MTDASAQKQLQIIQEIADIARKHFITVALRGGWALDFSLGRITRQHEDIDFNAWAGDADRLQDALLAGGYELEGTPPEPYVLRNFLKYGEGIQVAFVEKITDGVICPTGYSEYPLSIELMEGPIATLEGVTCRTATAEALLDTKNKKLFWDEGEEYRKKDLVDMKLLSDFIKHN